MKHIVVDLEMNTVSRKSDARRICKSETIEIGAVMLDEEMHEISAFRTYVKPIYNVGIVPRITQLTGITNGMVANAPQFQEAFKMFANWCIGTGDEFTIYAWSNSDYSQIQKELQLKPFDLSDAEASVVAVPWSDFQQEFDCHLGFDSQVSLHMALEMAGIDFVGHQHDALDDARNTAELLQAFRDEEVFAQTLRRIEEAMKPTPIGTSLGTLLAGYAGMVS